MALGTARAARMRGVRLVAGASLIALACGGQAFAQAKSDPTDVSELVITAARTTLPASALPMTVDIVDASTLSQQVSISGSIVEAISSLSPSFSPTRQKLSGSGETLRGRSPLFAINGIPQSTPIRDGSRDGFTIDAFFIDHVELIYGSNALQGIGATGGVVNQVTVGPPKTDGVSGRVLAQVGSDSRFHGDGLGWKTAGLVGYRSGAFDATLGLAYEARGAFYDGLGRRIGVDNTQGEIQNSKSTSVFGRFGWQIDESLRVDVVANRFELKGDGDYVIIAGDRTQNRPASSMRGTVDGQPAANRVETVSLSVTDDDLLGGDLTAQVFYNRSRDTFGGDRSVTFQDVRLAPAGTLFDQSSNRSKKLGARLGYEREIPFVPGLTSTFGLDAMKDRTEQSLIQTKRVWVPPTEFRSIAPFAQANLALLDDRVHLAGGVRYESVTLKVGDYTTLASYGSRAVGGGEPSFGATLLNGGIVVKPMDALRLYASYAEGYTVPDVGRILRGVNRNGVDVDNFLDINPVVSDNQEIGAEWKHGPIEATAAYFWSTSKLGQLLVLNPATAVYDVQRQRVEIEGLELNVTAQTPVPGVKLSAGYAKLKGRADSNADGSVDIDLDGANISPDRVNVALTYQSGPLAARLQSQTYLERDFDGADPRNSFGGYTLVDVSVRYSAPVADVFFSIQNLFDEQYLSYSSDTANPTDNLRYFAGRGRSFTLGVERKF
ncbi:MAG: TonB-dependent receptor [Pseudomonadota bacterium]|uniref:TonB-dependent receptor n=1 Tax=unclassified Phenylobacterium TaxID=2640670 RepID=UPI0006F632A8|nr:MULTISPECIES: TonB-dependent receptor [unclassified Phenylobacterium]KRB48669.1 TonB-dependent receptor [Phenylobacterium sp. Root700]